MFEHQIQLRVRYSETDQMGYVYYGNYAQYFEVARVESLRSLGITYKELEEEGILLPVLDFSIKYFKPAFYDDLLSIKVMIPVLPATRIIFEYETSNQSEEIINKATTTLVFIKKQSGKPCIAPDDVISRMNKYYAP